MIVVSPSPLLPGWYFGHASPARASIPEITHSFQLRLETGSSETIPQAATCALLRCTSGSVWITHDGDPKDVVLGPGDSYVAPRADPMVVHALQPSALEMHFKR